MRRDLVSGTALGGFGLAYALYTAMGLPLGSLNRMGPGMFPFGLGLLLALFGLVIAINALAHDERISGAGVKTACFILGALAVFALSVQRFGLVVAIVLATCITSWIMPKRSLRVVAMLCVFLTLLAWLLFKIVLGINIPMFAWRLV